MLRRFIQDRRGASAAEYALVLAILGVSVGAASMTMGGNVDAAMNNAAENGIDPPAYASGPGASGGAGGSSGSAGVGSPPSTTTGDPDTPDSGAGGDTPTKGRKDNGGGACRNPNRPC